VEKLIWGYKSLIELWTERAAKKGPSSSEKGVEKSEENFPTMRTKQTPDDQ
jgi:hypothetical protein